MQANVVIGFASESNKSIPWLFYFMAMVSGASEILIPNLIKQTEGKIGIKSSEKKEENKLPVVSDKDIENDGKKNMDKHLPP